MTDLIYKTEYTFNPENTKEEAKAARKDLKKAIKQGYTYISDATQNIFYIQSKDNLIHIGHYVENDQHEFEEDLQEEFAEDYDIKKHNIMLIDQIINNTLRQKNDIRPDQADTLLKLASLQSMIIDNKE